MSGRAGMSVWQPTYLLYSSAARHAFKLDGPNPDDLGNFRGTKGPQLYDAYCAEENRGPQTPVRAEQQTLSAVGKTTAQGHRIIS